MSKKVDPSAENFCNLFRDLNFEDNQKFAKRMAAYELIPKK